jgi:hypothetical protein
LYDLAGGVAGTPIVPSTNALLTDEEVLGIVDILVRSTLY